MPPKDEPVKTTNKENPPSLPVKHYRYVCHGCTNTAAYLKTGDPIPTSITCAQCGKVQDYKPENCIEL